MRASPILQIEIKHEDNQRTYLHPVQLFQKSKKRFFIGEMRFSVEPLLEKDHSKFSRYILNYNHKRYIIEKDSDLVIDIKKEKYIFSLYNDIVLNDEEVMFKFFKYSISTHLAVMIISLLLTIFLPEKKMDQNLVQVDKQRIEELMKKINKDKKVEVKKEVPEVVKKEEPKPEEVKPEEMKPDKIKIEELKPKEKIVKKGPPKEKEIAKKEPPKKKQAPQKSISKKENKNPPKRLVVQEGPPKRGGHFKSKSPPKDTASIARPQGGGSKSNSNAIAKANLAKAQAAQKNQLVSALGFLSPGKSKFVANAPSGSGESGKKFGSSLAANPKNAKSYLSNLASAGGAKGSGLGGSIKTIGAKDIATGKVISAGSYGGSDDSKSLTRVQGKVSTGHLYGAGGGGFGENESGAKVQENGRLDSSVIEQTLAKYMQKFQYCYEKALLSAPSLRGNLTMKWSISTSGRASSVKVTKSELNNSNLHRCVSGIISSISFPTPKGGSVIVSYPFNFSSTSL